MKRLLWRLAVISLSLVAVYLLSARLPRRQRILGLAAVAVGLVSLVSVALTKISRYSLWLELTSPSSPLVWVGLAEIVGVMVWLLLLSRDSWRSRAPRLACVTVLGVGAVTVLTYRFATSGMRQEMTLPPFELADESTSVTSGRGDWPCWRGGRGNIVADNGIAATSEPQLLWETKLSGVGHSTPCVWGDTVVVTAAQTRTQIQQVAAVHRDDGRPLWERVVHQSSLPKKHVRNSHASSTPCCDGKHVFAVFANSSAVHITAIELADGQMAWQTRVGDYQTGHNYAASPAIYGPFVIVTVEGNKKPSVVAVWRDSGRLAWRTRLRLGGPNFSSPIVVQQGGRNQLALATASAVVGLDPSTGEPLWSCNWPVQQAVATIASSGDQLYATGTFPRQETLCLSLASDGEPSVAWRNRRAAGQVPSPVVFGRMVFLAEDDGVLSCLDADTGEVFSRRRIRCGLSASPLLAGDELYLAGEDGEVFVFRAERSLELVRSFDLGEPTMASPVGCGGQIFFRTETRLICFGTSPAGAMGSRD